MAVTGLLLCGFLIAHLVGNCLLLVSREAFNTYAHALTSNPLIYLAEVALATLFLTHIGMGLKLAVENRRARGQRYVLSRSTGRGEGFAATSMVYTGLWTLVFLLIHLVNFRIAGMVSKERIVYGGEEVVDLYGLVMEHFQSTEWTGYYVLSMVVLGIHLSHGLPSSLQSLGCHHPRYTPAVKCLGLIYSLAMALGFSTVALYCHLKGVSL